MIDSRFLASFIVMFGIGFLVVGCGGQDSATDGNNPLLGDWEGPARHTLSFSKTHLATEDNRYPVKKYDVSKEGISKVWIESNGKQIPYEVTLGDSEGVIYVSPPDKPSQMRMKYTKRITQVNQKAQSVQENRNKPLEEFYGTWKSSRPHPFIIRSEKLVDKGETYPIVDKRVEGNQLVLRVEKNGNETEYKIYLREENRITVHPGDSPFMRVYTKPTQAEQNN